MAKSLVYRVENRRAAGVFKEQLDEDLRLTTIRLGDRTKELHPGDVIVPEIKFGKTGKILAEPRQLLSVEASPIKQVDPGAMLADGFRSAHEVKFTLEGFHRKGLTLDSEVTTLTSTSLKRDGVNQKDLLQKSWLYWLGRESDLHGALPSHAWPDALYVRGLISAEDLPGLKKEAAQEDYETTREDGPDNRWYAVDEYDRMVNETEED